MQGLAKNIGAAVLGWVAMAAGVFVLHAVMWMILGPDGAFRPETWEISPGWLLGSILIGLLAAAVGGFLCSKISDGPWGVRLLVVIVVVFGVLVALGNMEVTGWESGVGAAGEAGPGPRPEGVGMFEAMATAQQPVWLTWLNPLLGAVGALLGARLNRSKGE